MKHYTVYVKETITLCRVVHVLIPHSADHTYAEQLVRGTANPMDSALNPCSEPITVDKEVTYTGSVAVEAKPPTLTCLKG